MDNIEFKIFKAGYCLQNEICSIVKGKNIRTKFYAMFVLINHPKMGYILFDTGYSEQFYKAAKKFPYSIYSKITPVVIDENNTAKKQLENNNINCNEIKYIIISHFHADHIAGLKDFPNAKFICLKKGWENLKNKTGFKALKEGFLPDLIPEDFSKRVVFIDENKTTNANFKSQFEIYDIFKDNSLCAVDLSGHSKGQIGLIIKNTFFAADGCWYSKSYRENIPPPLWVRLILGNNKEYLNTLYKLHKFYKENPGFEIIPSHCNEFWSKYV